MVNVSAGMGRIRGAVVAVGAVAPLLAGCGAGGDTTSAGGDTTPGGTQATATTQDAAAPMQTGAADWQAAADALGRAGTLSNGTVYRVSFPRSALSVTAQGVPIEPGLALGVLRRVRPLPRHHHGDG
jgi:hypothetical protein